MKDMVRAAEASVTGSRVESATAFVGRSSSAMIGGAGGKISAVAQQATYADGLWDGRELSAWIPDVIDDVIDAVSPERVIVFGSVARGEQRDDSDLDLLVVLDEIDPGQRRRLMGRIRRAIAAPIPIDVLVTDRAEFEARKDVNGSPYYWPAREGLVVYERAAA